MPEKAPEELTNLEILARSFGLEGSDRDIRINNLLVEFAYEGIERRVSQLLAAGADVDAFYLDEHAFLGPGISGYTPLLRSAIIGDIEVVRLLLEAGADVTKSHRNKSPLYWASIQEHHDVAQLLVEAGSPGDPVQIRLTRELLRASCKGYKVGAAEGYSPVPGVLEGHQDAPTILEVLDRGADINSANPEGYTALMYAANLGLLGNVKTLLGQGADFKRESLRGDTALSLAEGEASVNVEGRKIVVEHLKRHIAGQP